MIPTGPNPGPHFGWSALGAALVFMKARESLDATALAQPLDEAIERLAQCGLGAIA